MEHWNVWYCGVMINRYPMNEEQARKMARLHRFNYGSDAKPIKAWTR